MDFNKKKQNLGEPGLLNFPGVDSYKEPEQLIPVGGYGQNVDKQHLYELLQKKIQAEQSNPDVMAMKAQENVDAATLTDTGVNPGFVPGPGDFGYVPPNPKFQKLKSILNGRQ